MQNDFTTKPIDRNPYKNTTTQFTQLLTSKLVDLAPVASTESSLNPNYPPFTPNLTSAPISICSTPAKGRGVFATRRIPAGEVIEISPVLCIPENEYYGGGKEGERKGVEGSVLQGYVFTWKGKEGGMAVALGIGSLFNHANNPNVSFNLSYSTYTIQYKTFRTVEAGEELSIFYGHGTHFSDDDNAIAGVDVVPESDAWGGLTGISNDEAFSCNSSEQHSNDDEEDEEDEVGGSETSTRVDAELKQSAGDEELLAWDDLPWDKVTDLIDPQDVGLTTLDCWVLDMPSRLVQVAFDFVRQHSVDYDGLGHLKRVRKTGDGEQLTVLLFSSTTAPPDTPTLIADSPLGPVASAPYLIPVPTTFARNQKQLDEWTKVWPVNIIPIREGPKASVKTTGWSRTKKEWIDMEIVKVLKAAKEAQRRGEHPIAMTVTDSFDPSVHSSTLLPKTLVRSFDTRLSTQNVLSHASANAIDAVAVLDRQGLRDPPLQPHLPFPYLLTGLTIFTTHEPCLLCSMSLLHSRIAQLYYVRKASGSGGCGSVYSVHEDVGLNHKFEVFALKRGEDGEGWLDILLDP